VWLELELELLDTKLLEIELELLMLLLAPLTLAEAVEAMKGCFKAASIDIRLTGSKASNLATRSAASEDTVKESRCF
jgi:hypothetical protein